MADYDVFVSPSGKSLQVCQWNGDRFKIIKSFRIIRGSTKEALESRFKAERKADEFIMRRRPVEL
jgi:hypothetical protein